MRRKPQTAAFDNRRATLMTLSARAALRCGCSFLVLFFSPQVASPLWACLSPPLGAWTNLEGRRQQTEAGRARTGKPGKNIPLTPALALPFLMR